MTDKVDLRIGLALSGGGVRASVFHLGVLSRLAVDHLLEQVTFISTVSGGTLVTGLLFAVNDYKWPTSETFLSRCLPKARYCLTKIDLQREVTRRAFLQPWYLLQGRAKLVSKCMQHYWGIWGDLNDIPLEPRWVLNATTYESGRNWRFIPQRRMGDYNIGYVRTPSIDLADAMAASAAYPGLIGPLILKTSDYNWFHYRNGEEVDIKPSVPKIHLWDGGVYDNMGIEPLYKTGKSVFRKELNFAIICDASGSMGLTHCPPDLRKRLQHLVVITMDQIRSLRARTLVDHFNQHENSGVYLKIGNLSARILAATQMKNEQIALLCKDSLPNNSVKAAVTFPTTLRRLSDEEYTLLFTHGWEVANYTLHSRCPDLFSHIPSRANIERV